MMVHLTKEEVLSLAAKRGHDVIGDAVFTTMLGCYQFIVNLGAGDCEVLRFGVAAFIPVRRK
jgi:hypothetical protein